MRLFMSPVRTKIGTVIPVMVMHKFCRRYTEDYRPAIARSFTAGSFLHLKTTRSRQTDRRVLWLVKFNYLRFMLVMLPDLFSSLLHTPVVFGRGIVLSAEVAQCATLYEMNQSFAKFSNE